MEEFLAGLERALWGWPLLILILGTGLYLTIRLRGKNFQSLGRAMGLVFRGSGTQEGVSPFGALCTSLAATVGTGNIVGVSTALMLGGPGALLWMELSALTGMAIKYAEGYFAVKHRFLSDDRGPRGGPFAYILLGLGSKWRFLAVCFALCGAMAGLLGVGTFVQVGSVTSGIRYYLEQCVPQHHNITLLGREYPLLMVLAGVGMFLGTGLLVFRGIERISRASSVLVPLMGGIYVLCCLWILAAHSSELPGALIRIVRGAFTPGAAGAGLMGTIQAGVSRGVFSNEAGLGTAPIAAASANTESPTEQGLITMTSSVFDTGIVCTLSGLVILVTGADIRHAGLWSAVESFAIGLPLPASVSRGIVIVCLALFAFTTVVGWSFYGVQCLDFLTKENPGLRRLYLFVYTFTVLLAPYVPVRALWSAANICNGLMAIPNLTAILLLSPQLRLDVRDIIKQRSEANGNPVSG